MVDSEAVRRKLERLEGALVRLAGVAGLADADFLASADARDVAARNVQVAAQACIDLANHVIADRRLRAPETAAESFEVLAADGVIDEALASELARVAGLRNVLVHEYDRVDELKVLGAARRPEPLLRFAAAVRALLRPSGPSSVREPRVRYRKTPPRAFSPAPKKGRSR
jgi:uncharacterized protein YutE (UPF0331/DUF86 family)